MPNWVVDIPLYLYFVAMKQEDETQIPLCWIFGAFSKYSIDLYNDRTMEKKFSHYVILNESKVTEEEIATQFETLTGSEGDYSRQSDYIFYQSLEAVLKNRGNTPVRESSDSSVFTTSSDSDNSDTSNVSSTGYISDQNSHSDDVNEVYVDPIPPPPGTVRLHNLDFEHPQLSPSSDDNDYIPPRHAAPDPVGILPERTNGNAALYADILLLQMTLLESLEMYTRENENRRHQQDNEPMIEEIVVSSDVNTVGDRESNGSVD